MPTPSALQVVPSQAAMLLQGLQVPAVLKRPPAYSVVPLTASASTGPFMPEPSALQAVPSQAAMEAQLQVPAVLKKPPAYSVVPPTASAYTKLFMPGTLKRGSQFSSPATAGAAGTKRAGPAVPWANCQPAGSSV